jgi:hypothetical protein
VEGDATTAKRCARCAVPFPWKNYVGKRKYCSDACARANERQRREALSDRHPSNRSTGTVGAISELVVTVDLLNRGFDVFRAVSPSCSCDLIAMKDGTVLRIEVRTAYQRKDGTLGHHRRIGEESNYDVMAAVHATGLIVYTPPIIDRDPGDES